MMRNILLLSILAAGGIVCAKEKLILVENREPQAVIVTADMPAPVAEYAARELASYLKKSTGAELPLVRESDLPAGKQIRIYIGATKAAERAGLGQKTFSGESYAIKAVDGGLFIVGGENGKPLLYEPDAKRSKQENGRLIWTENGIVRDARRGTLYGVYRFLSTFSGIRWLWPGELGTYVPEKKVLAVDGDLNITGAPAFQYRKYRIWQVLTPFFRGQAAKETDKLSFSKEGLADYCRELRKYLLVYQEGDSAPLPAPASHLDHWWGKYGKTHPEWFAMGDDGTRKPFAGGRSARLCVSNPGLAEFIVGKLWDGGEWIGLGEADTRGFCRCRECMSWDQPQPSGFKGYSTANRYLRYARNVRELARKRNPRVKISILMYMDYIMPPTGNPDLSWMYGKFVPWGSGVECYYPMKESSAKEIMDIWSGWRKTGIQMHYRPNYLLSGYAIPALELKQSGEMLRFAGRNGMVGFDYDSLLGYWATKGPMLYMHMRLGTDPSLDLDSVLDEYYSAFGPAAGQVRRYFDYWIAFTEKLPHGGVEYGNAQQAADYYPLEVFDEPGKILEKALEEAKKSKKAEFAERVRFLRNGLKHARICVEFSRLFQKNQFSAARGKLKELIDFRRAHEKEFIADYPAALFAEKGGYQGLEDFMQGRFRYFSDPRLRIGEFKYSAVKEIKGLRPGKWGLTLPGKAAGGYVVYLYNAGKDNSFVSADLSIFARAKDISNRLEISYDGKEYQLVASDLEKRKVDLSSLVAGRNLFYLRFSVTRRTEDQDGKLSLVEFRLDYIKKNPEEKKERPKLNAGTGWLDFHSDWFFRKDVRNAGLPAKEMLLRNFSSERWTKVDVPARLERTSVGPYLGTGWYATVFTVPKDWAARSMDILFEGVDEQAWVYLNGKLIGEHTVKSEGVDVGILWNEPFIVHAGTENINTGGKNLLIVKTHASKGAHGIWKPVKIRPVDASAK